MSDCPDLGEPFRGLARARRIDARITIIMTKASIGAACEQVLMLSLRILAQQFCGFAATAERRLS